MDAAEAQIILSRRRAAAIAENDRRIAEINKNIPQIREINRQIFNSSRELFAFMFAKPESTGEKTPEETESDRVKRREREAQRIETLKLSNLEAQAMCRELLRQNGYPEDYLDIHYSCPVCNDTGTAPDGGICDCVHRINSSLAAKELNRSSQLKLSTFDSFRLTYYSGDDYAHMERIFEFTKRYAASFRPDSDNILMFGKTGLGKTHLSLAIANAVLDKGCSVIYDSTINLLLKIEQEHFGHEHTNETLMHVMNCDLLILDDLGTEYKTPFYASTIYNIINTRLNSGKPIIISTNLNIDTLRERYEERVVSRISTCYSLLKFAGNDVRSQIKRERTANRNP